jgi:hypothetical protein
MVPSNTKHEIEAFVLVTSMSGNEYWDEEVLYRLIFAIQKRKQD